MKEESFSNKDFWDERYDKNPALGSGRGSRGNVLAYKKQILYPFVRHYATGGILDVGCGDLELMKNAPDCKYTGIDVSEEALKLGKQKRPNWEFLPADSSELDDRNFELVICMDVLIHQPTKDDYSGLIDFLVDKSQSAIIVAAFNSEPPEFNSEITFYYEGIADTLDRHNEIESVHEIGNYRDTAVVIALKKGNKGDRATVDDLIQSSRNLSLRDITLENKKQSLLKRIINKVSRLFQ